MLAGKFGFRIVGRCGAGPGGESASPYLHQAHGGLHPLLPDAGGGRGGRGSWRRPAGRSGRGMAGLRGTGLRPVGSLTARPTSPFSRPSPHFYDEVGPGPPRRLFVGVDPPVAGSMWRRMAGPPGSAAPPCTGESPLVLRNYLAQEASTGGGGDHTRIHGSLRYMRARTTIRPGRSTSPPASGVVPATSGVLHCFLQLLKGDFPHCLELHQPRTAPPPSATLRRQPARGPRFLLFLVPVLLLVACSGTRALPPWGWWDRPGPLSHIPQLRPHGGPVP